MTAISQLEYINSIITKYQRDVDRTYSAHSAYVSHASMIDIKDILDTAQSIEDAVACAAEIALTRITAYLASIPPKEQPCKNEN